MTVPQIILLTHASTVNRHSFDERYGDKSGSRHEDSGAVWNGKRFDELTTDEYASYLQSGQ